MKIIVTGLIDFPKIHQHYDEGTVTFIIENCVVTHAYQLGESNALLVEVELDKTE